MCINEEKINELCTNGHINKAKFDELLHICTETIDIHNVSREEAFNQIIEIYSKEPNAFLIEEQFVGCYILMLSQHLAILHNQELTKEQKSLKWKVPQHLEAWQVATLIFKTNNNTVPEFHGYDLHALVWEYEIHCPPNTTLKELKKLEQNTRKE